MEESFEIIDQKKGTFGSQMSWHGRFLVYDVKETKLFSAENGFLSFQRSSLQS